MQTIKITLRESGSIADIDKDFNLFRGSFQNVLLNVRVPNVLLLNQIERPGTTVSNVVKVGCLSINETGKQVKTKAYYLKFVKEFEQGGKKFSLFERLLPRSFTLYQGIATLIANVVNVVTDEYGSRLEQITTTQRTDIDVFPSDYLDEDDPIEPSEIERINGILNNILGWLEHGQKLISIRIPINEQGLYWWDDDNNITIPQGAHNIPPGFPMYVFLRKSDGTVEQPRHDGFRINNDGSITLYTRTPWTGSILISGSVAGTSAGIEDAPFDGNMYARKDGMWVKIENIEPPIPASDYFLMNTETDMLLVNTDTDMLVLEGGG